MKRVALRVRGTVQGVGFRPWVKLTANELGLSGWVRNATSEVVIEVEGVEDKIHDFIHLLQEKAPPPIEVAEITIEERDVQCERGFLIQTSALDSSVVPLLPADMASCKQCLHEIQDPMNRRYKYPFTNCTQCGPRYSIVSALPYDRENTTMHAFTMCEACRREYQDETDRRYHAQPIACPQCGPHVHLTDGQKILNQDVQAMEQAVQWICDGKILALKGVGGFQLLVDATHEQAVQRLRYRKHREGKPFAVMFSDIDQVRSYCDVSLDEAALLKSARSPIVLVRSRGENAIALAKSVSLSSPYVGAMCPSSPLHWLLCHEVDRPLVCTSGNLSGEPMSIDEGNAVIELSNVADGYIVHDRPIAHPIDDSVVRVDPHGVSILRRARGYTADKLIHAPNDCVVLALGAHLKSTIALGMRDATLVSPHLGDLSSTASVDLFRNTIKDYLSFYRITPHVVACDMHPDYASSHIAEEIAEQFHVELVRVQHHHAHVAAVAMEHDLCEPYLGFAWDGTGYGLDGTMWGGETFVVNGRERIRFAQLRMFPLPGGDMAVRDIRRIAAGLLYTMEESIAEILSVTQSDARIWTQMMARNLNSPKTSSMGRLFDAIAALIGMRASVTFEGQAAMELEYIAEEVEAEPYPFPICYEDDKWVADWEPLVGEILADMRCHVDRKMISARFHESLVRLSESIAERANVSVVVLSGGCFQNRQLLYRCRKRLLKKGFRVYLPSRFPINDGSISLGQVAIARSKWSPYVPRNSRSDSIDS